MQSHLSQKLVNIAQILLSFTILSLIYEQCLGYQNYAKRVSNVEILGEDVFFEILEPSELKYTYRIRPAKDFGAQFNESFVLKNVPLVPVIPRTGCVLPENVDDVEGSVAFIQRGYCSFKVKTQIAEKAGALAVIITDEEFIDDYFIGMLDDPDTGDVSIPAAYLLGRNGQVIRQTLQKLKQNFAIINLPVNLTYTPIHKIHQPPWLQWF